MLFRSTSLAAFAALLLCTGAATAQVSLTSTSTPVTQDFDTLASTGTSSVLPTGWAIAESGTNANAIYTAGTGSANGGDTYSFGAAAASERALGGLQSGSLIPSFGAQLQNNTGGVLSGLLLSYRGEQWRLGALARADQLIFEYSTDATSLITGTWTLLPALDFTGPVQAGTTGLLDGNAAANFTLKSGSVTGLSVASGASVWIRWRDFNATGADDGLAIDDVSITAQGSGSALAASINDVSVTEGNAGFTNASFTVSLSAPALGGESITVATANGSATEPSDYTATTTTLNFTVGQTSQSFVVPVVGDTTSEPNETYAVNLSAPGGGLVIGDGAGLGTITNDDFTLTPINQIQGSGLVSPIADGTAVTTEGIVTGIKTNGFFIQSSDAEADANAATSEGILVFTGTGAVPASVVLGARVRVAGNVKEFIPSTDPAQPPTTELEAPLTVTQLSLGNPLPTTVPITTINAAGSFNQLENLEHMRVSIASLVVVAGTRGFTDEPNATGSTNGVFWATLPGAPRPRREPGIDIRETLLPTTPVGVPRFDSNPETLRVDSDALVTAVARNLVSGQTIGAQTGILDYGVRFYTFLPDPGQSPSITAASAPNSAAPAGASDFTVATYNMERFFDTVNDPATSDAVLTATAFANRLSKASLQIRQNLGAPDILAVVEMENLVALQALATKIAADGGPTYNAFLNDGNDPGGIDVGFLTKNGRVSVTSVTQFGLTATYLNPTTNLQELLNDRPPLVLVATITSVSGGTADVTVVANHLRSFLGITDPVDGARIRAKRLAQAEFVANLIQTRQAANANERIVVLGDFNAYEFNDGYVDSMGTILGNPAPATQVTLAGADLVNPNFTRLIDASADYSYSFDGFTQSIDHILVSQGLITNSSARSLTHVRFNADYPEVARSDYSAAANTRLSDHDALVLSVTVPALGVQPTSCVLTSTTATPAAGSPVNYRVVMTPSTASGTVNVTAGVGESCSGTVASGEINCTITYASAGARTINAAFTGSSGFQNSTCGPLTQTISPVGASVALTSTVNPSTFGQSVLFTAIVTGIAPTGVVTFFNGATVLGTGTLAGTGNQRSASFGLSTLPVGTSLITASYPGDSNNAAMTSSPLTQVVQAAGTSCVLSSTTATPVVGSAVNYRVLMTPTSAAGTATVTAGVGESCTATVASGEANCTITYASAGARTINAAFTGGSGFQNSTCGPLAQTIAPASSSVALSSSVNPSAIGQSVLFTATVTGIAPTGIVTFRNGAAVLGTGTLAGTGNQRTATFGLGSLAVGTAAITASYAGDGNNAAMTSAALNQVVQAGLTNTSLVVSPAQPALGQPVTMTATVNVLAPAVGPATGIVTFLDGATVLGTAPLVNGVAVLNLANGLPAGNRSLSARYEGGAGYNGSSSAVVLGGSLVAVPTLGHLGFLLLLGMVIGLGLVAVRRESEI